MGEVIRKHLLYIVVFLLYQSVVNGNECAPCTCNYPSKVYCRGLGLTVVPKFSDNITANIISLDLMNNNISSLDATSFNGMYQLERLTLWNNNLRQQ